MNILYAETLVILLSVALTAKIIYHLIIKPFLYAVEAKARNKKIAKDNWINILESDDKEKTYPGKREHICPICTISFVELLVFINESVNEKLPTSINI
ncbi:MAG: hypothetical protein ABIP51_23745 [Bacteroidia bacterium]